MAHNPRHLAAMILQLGKNLAPDRFPKPDPAVLDAWTLVVKRKTWPPELWSEAVLVWAEEMASDRMCTPRELLHAGTIVRNRWETDPTHGPKLKAWREHQADLRDQQLRDGTFAAIRGYQPPTPTTPKPIDPTPFVDEIKRNTPKTRPEAPQNDEQATDG